jgi:hypothetical protein
MGVSGFGFLFSLREGMLRVLVVCLPTALGFSCAGFFFGLSLLCSWSFLSARLWRWPFLVFLLVY